MYVEILAGAVPVMVALALLVRLVKSMLWPTTTDSSVSTPAATKTDHEYDVIIVGCSIAGPALASALAQQGNRRVLVVERSLWEKPDRIVGELLQPGGIQTLSKIGMEKCALDVGSMCEGYVVQNDAKDWVQLPFRAGFHGVSFHFGDFVQKLREHTWKRYSRGAVGGESVQPSVEMIEGTVTAVLTEELPGGLERAYGIKYLRAKDYRVPANPFDLKDSEGAALPPSDSDERITITATAPLIVMCDGGASKFKPKYAHFRPAAKYHSHFVGLILKGAQLPQEKRGTVYLGKTGPILSYRLDPNEVRLLVDYPGHHLPTPLELQKWLTNEIAPQLSESMAVSLKEAASEVQNIRSMPISCYPQTYSATLGLVGIGDHNNQRHPLTGGGMTCAFRDAVLLADNLAAIPNLRSSNPAELTRTHAKMQKAILAYSRQRFAHSSCINILSWALYRVFGSVVSMRHACFDYFLRGGICVSDPMDMLSGLQPSPLLLLYHYYRVMFFGAYNLITLSGTYAGVDPKTKKPNQHSIGTLLFNSLTFFVNPVRLFGAAYLLVYATYVFLPLGWMEIVSLWKLADPTSWYARSIIRPLERGIIRTLRKAGKPVAI